MTERRVPTHLVVLLGVSTGAYALTLAGVTALQSAADARVIAQRRPAQQVVDRATRQHDAAEQATDAAADWYATLADRYDRSGSDLGGLDVALGELADRTATLSASASTLHVAPFRLPQVGRTVTRTAAPTTHATTRASGG